MDEHYIEFTAIIGPIDEPHITELRARAETAEAERDRLRAVVEALAPFTDHAEDCAVEVDYPCNCGLDRIHAQLDGSAEGTDG